MANGKTETRNEDDGGFVLYGVERTEEERRKAYGTKLKGPVNERQPGVVGTLRALFR